MNSSEILKTITKFYDIVSSTTLTEEEKDYVRYINLKMAEAIIKDMGSTEAIRIANTIILTAD